MSLCSFSANIEKICSQHTGGNTIVVNTETSLSCYVDKGRKDGTNIKTGVAKHGIQNIKTRRYDTKQQNDTAKYIPKETLP